MNGNSKFILCVDDDPDDRLVITEAIRDIDPSFSVKEACNGIEANEFLQKAKQSGHFPCLVILDINMPLMDGKEALKEIQKDEILKTVPVVLFSTSSNPIDKLFSIEHGVEFFTKPSDHQSILSIIRKLLSPFRINFQ